MARREQFADQFRALPEEPPLGEPRGGEFGLDLLRHPSSCDGERHGRPELVPRCRNYRTIRTSFRRPRASGDPEPAPLFMPEPAPGMNRGAGPGMNRGASALTLVRRKDRAIADYDAQSTPVSTPGAIS
jgi:hypothetical protein